MHDSDPAQPGRTDMAPDPEPWMTKSYASDNVNTPQG